MLLGCCKREGFYWAALVLMVIAFAVAIANVVADKGLATRLRDSAMWLLLLSIAGILFATYHLHLEGAAPAELEVDAEATETIDTDAADATDADADAPAGDMPAAFSGLLPVNATIAGHQALLLEKFQQPILPFPLM